MRSSHRSETLEPPESKETDQFSTYYSETCIEVIFLLTRFREFLGLPEFTYMEFEEELMREDQNYKQNGASIHRSMLMNEIFEALLLPYSKKHKTRDWYKLIVLFAKKHFSKNPFGDDESIDYHLLPTNVKLWVLLRILYHYCGKEDAQEVDQWKTPNELRVQQIGTNSEKLEILHFHDMRVFKKHPASTFRRRAPLIPHHFIDGASWSEAYIEVLRGDHYECIANNQTSWDELIDQWTKSKNLNERKMSEELSKTLKKHGHKFVQTLDEYHRQRRERNKKLILQEYEMRKNLGLFRSSARIQERKTNNDVVSNFNKYFDEEETETTAIEQKEDPTKMSREERALRREGIKAETVLNVEEKVFTNGNGHNGNMVGASPSSSGRLDRDNRESNSSSPSSSQPIEYYPPLRTTMKTGEILAMIRGQGTRKSVDPKPIRPAEIPQTNEEHLRQQSNEEHERKSIGEILAMLKDQDTRQRKEPTTYSQVTLPQIRSLVNVQRTSPAPVTEIEQPRVPISSSVAKRYIYTTARNATPVARVAAIQSGSMQIAGPSSPNKRRLSEGARTSNIAERRVKFEGTLGRQQFVVPRHDDMDDFTTIATTSRADGLDSRLRMKVVTAVRLISSKYTEYYNEWSSFYNIKVMPREFAAIVTAIPTDDSAITIAEWANIKNIIFRMPMRIGGVEQTLNLDKGKPQRCLAYTLMRFNLSSWPLIFGKILSMEDQLLMKKTEECCEIIKPFI